jgi:DnaJ-class molecular chaperone
MAVCPNCNERGKIYGPPGTLKMNAHWKECPSCHGTGEVQGYWRKCNRCKGWGEVGYVFISPDPCPECNGRGIVPDRAPDESDKKQRGRSIRIDFD